MSIRSVMNDICTLYAPAEALGGWDSSSGKYVVKGNAPCRLITAAGSQFIDGRIRNETTHVLFLITDLTIEPSWMVEVSGIRYQIIPPINDAGGRIGHHTELQLKEYE